MTEFPLKISKELWEKFLKTKPPFLDLDVYIASLISEFCDDLWFVKQRKSKDWIEVRIRVNDEVWNRFSEIKDVTKNDLLVSIIEKRVKEYEEAKSE